MRVTNRVIKITRPEDVGVIKYFVDNHKSYVNGYIKWNEEFHMIVTACDDHNFCYTLNKYRFEYQWLNELKYDFYSGRIIGADYNFTEETFMQTLKENREYLAADYAQKLLRVDIKSAIEKILAHRGISIPSELYKDKFEEDDERFFNRSIQLNDPSVFKDPETWWKLLVDTSVYADDPNGRLDNIIWRIRAATNLKK